MTKPINDFSDAKVGDKVTCYHLGHGEIVNVFASTWPAQVLCQFERENHRRGYRTDGRLTPEDAGPMLFKGHVDFPDPIPVKRKVKKTNKRWVLVHYCTLSHSVKTSGLVYSLEEAQKSRKGDEVIQEIEISMEVEE